MLVSGERHPDYFSIARGSASFISNEMGATRVATSVLGSGGVPIPGRFERQIRRSANLMRQWRGKPQHSDLVVMRQTEVVTLNPDTADPAAWARLQEVVDELGLLEMTTAPPPQERPRPTRGSAKGARQRRGRATDSYFSVDYSDRLEVTRGSRHCSLQLAPFGLERAGFTELRALFEGLFEER